MKKWVLYTQANEHDITDGVGGGLFGSMDSCTRSQIVTFLFMAR